MRHPTIQVPLLRQPPVYMVLAVVLVALVPLGLRMFGSGAAAAPMSADPVQLVAETAMAQADLQTLRPTCLPDPTQEQLDMFEELEELEELEGFDVEELEENQPLRAIAMALDEPADEDADAEILIIDDVEKPKTKPKAKTRRRSSSRGLLGKARRAYAKGQPKAAYKLAGRSARKKPTAAARLVQVKAACDLRNKGAARAAYRTLPRGDVRKQARRQCRENGILLL